MFTGDLCFCTYTCVETFETPPVCEDGTLELSCATGTISVTSVFYGALEENLGNCTHATAPVTVAAGDTCSFEGATSRVQEECNGLSDCSFVASNVNFQGSAQDSIDPCQSIVKRAMANWTCEVPPSMSFCCFCWIYDVVISAVFRNLRNTLHVVRHATTKSSDICVAYFLDEEFITSRNVQYLSHLCHQFPPNREPRYLTLDASL